jgi:hypothetical protein
MTTHPTTKNKSLTNHSMTIRHMTSYNWNPIDYSSHWQLVPGQLAPLHLVKRQVLALFICDLKQFAKPTEHNLENIRERPIKTDHQVTCPKINLFQNEKKILDWHIRDHACHGARHIQELISPRLDIRMTYRHILLWKSPSSDVTSPSPAWPFLLF